MFDRTRRQVQEVCANNASNEVYLIPVMELPNQDNIQVSVSSEYAPDTLLKLFNKTIVDRYDAWSTARGFLTAKTIVIFPNGKWVTKYRITTRHVTEYVTTPYVSPIAWIL